MNCEQVFDVLTRGPFPTGGSIDDAVEAHLSRCTACRRLAFALQPALELFEEAVAPEESRDLPAYWGELFVPKPTRTARKPRVARAAPRAEQRPQARRPAVPSWPWLNLGRFALAIAVGVSLGVALSAAVGETTTRQAPTPPPPADAPPRLAWAAKPIVTDLAGLESLGLKPACRPVLFHRGLPPGNGLVLDGIGGLDIPQDGGRLPEWAQLSGGSAASLAQQCCTQCHVAGRQQQHSDEAVSRILASCRHCHTH